ncbi:MAG: PQQ-like beta-propeller repeat protein [Candidatus Riflebacteria bacterium]|nr:PQQ-like beta-propeller repeat protein [Candidatus Riflebacteria bacterium]
MFRFNLLPAITGIIVSFLAFGPLYSLLDKPANSGRFLERVPGMDKLPPEGRKKISKVKIGEFFERFDDSLSNKNVSNAVTHASADADKQMKGSWPGFRGKDSTNISRENVPLLKTFNESGPPVLWRVILGEGHAAPAIHCGRVFILDYLEDKKADALRCFSLISGKELWRRYYKVDIKRNHGYSRTIPAVSSNHVITIGPMGHVMCVNPENGDLLWTIDMVEKFRGTIPQWYTGQCPLLDDKTVILAPGGENTLMAGIDADSGKILWESPNPGGLKMSHSSVVPMTFNGHKMYVYAAIGGIAGISAESNSAGRILWQTGDWGATVVAPSPVILSDGMIFQSAGYGAGSVLINVSGDKELFKAEIVRRFTPKEALATEQQTGVYYKNLLFGVLPKDAGSKRMMLVACDPADPSKFIFPGNSELRFGLGPFIIADDRFFALTDDGNLSMLTFEQNQFVRTGHSKVLQGVDAWGPPTIADGIMLLRDSTSMVCLDLSNDSRWSNSY